jgi:SAM-dependent methyltransferase
MRRSRAIPQDADPSNGYEECARAFIAARSNVGASTVRAWADSLTPGASVLELGCGFGAPVSEALTSAGCDLWAVDAAPSLIAEFRRRHPHARVACEPVETSAFFGRTFDAAVAIGIVFLLAADVQRALLTRVSAVLVPGGRFLFTAPLQRCTWRDKLTGRLSVSLGDRAYREAIAAAGLSVVAEHVDDGNNHHYDCRRDA